MKAILQRVNHASVSVNGDECGSINKGIFVLLGIKQGDSKADADFLVKKIVELRIFSDFNDKLNLSVKDIGGELLIVSNFTIYGNAQKGRRPDFILSEKYDKSLILYNYFISKLKETDVTIQSGIFGADMKIETECDGPVTIIITSENDNAKN